MGYRVEYGVERKEANQLCRQRSRIPKLTLLFFVLFLLLVNALWPDGREALQELLWPGDADVTRQAVETFADNLRFGYPLMDAVESFCREIIQNADPGA